MLLNVKTIKKTKNYYS